MLTTGISSGKAPMCVSACVVSSNTMYLSTNIDPQGEVC